MNINQPMTNHHTEATRQEKKLAQSFDFSFLISASIIYRTHPTLKNAQFGDLLGYVFRMESGTPLTLSYHNLSGH
jgi:hypothetical protein